MHLLILEDDLDLGHSLQAQGDAWESVARKLCGT